MPNVRVTEQKFIDVDSECKDNPVYLQWWNTKGGPSYWLFHRNQTDLVNTSSAGEYIKNEPDMEYAIGGAEFLGKNADPSMLIGADVPISKMDGIKGLIISPKVLMLMNPETWTTDVGGPKWQRVKVQTGSFIVLKRTETRQRVELVLLLPEINVQSE